MRVFDSTATTRRQFEILQAYKWRQIRSNWLILYLSLLRYRRLFNLRSARSFVNLFSVSKFAALNQPHRDSWTPAYVKMAVEQHASDKDRQIGEYDSNIVYPSLGFLAFSTAIRLIWMFTWFNCSIPARLGCPYAQVDLESLVLRYCYCICRHSR